jgi:very-short-patch-repair endonuclease
MSIRKWTKEEDEARQKELEEMGFNVIRFTDTEILKHFEGVKECILLKLNQ